MFVVGEGEVIGRDIPASARASTGREIPSGHLLDIIGKSWTFAGSWHGLAEAGAALPLAEGHAMQPF